MVWMTVKVVSSIKVSTRRQNEMQKNIRNLLLGFIVGVLVSAAVGYYGFIRPAESRNRQLAAELSTSLRQNTVSRGYLAEASTILKSSGDSFTRIRRIINLLQKAELDPQMGSITVRGDSGR